MWIHQHPKWPNFTWHHATLEPLLAAIRHQQGRLLGRIESLGFDLKQEATLQTLTQEVVTTSAIEGETINPAEVRSSLARRLGIETPGLVPASRYVDGMVEMMLDATQHFDQPLTATRLFRWHAALFPTGFSGLHRITVGDWRQDPGGPMQVVSGPLGRERVHFEAPETARVGAEMAAFLEWFDGETTTDPVLKAGIAHLWFVTIHPFDDGNGRIARAIADLALARADGIPQRFYAMSAQLEAERKDYYLQLERQQRSDVDLTDWLTWFLQCLGRTLDRAQTVLEAVLYKAQLWAHVNPKPVNARQRVVLNRMLEDFQGFMTSSKYAKIAKCSQDTAQRDIRELVAWRVLIPNPGKGRSTSYRLARLDELAA